jgi:hypothetical protein
MPLDTNTILDLEYIYFLKVSYVPRKALKYGAQILSNSWELLLGDDSYSYVDIPSCQIQDEG